MPPGVLRGEMYLAYVHSQTNSQTFTKLRSNRSSSLTASPDFWIYDPLKPPAAGNAPWGIEERIVFSLCPFPDEFADVDQIWCQSVHPFDRLPRLLNVWLSNPPPPKCPLGYCGLILFSLYLFPDESADGYQMWCQSVQPFDSLPSILNVWPPNPLEMPPGVLRGELYLAYVHSQTNPQTCTKYGANWSNRLTASPYFWIFDPLKRPKSPPPVYRGAFVWRISIPRWIRRHEPKLVLIGPAVWQLP